MSETRQIFIGRRKSSVARVSIESGDGKFMVNGMPADDYFRRKTLGLVIRQPINLVTDINKYNINVNVQGGGWSGQAGAVRLGLARALNSLNESWRPELKKIGYLTRDSRKVERKKYGKKKARKSFQFSKR